MLLFDAVTYAVFAAALNIRKFQEIVRQRDRDASLLNEQLTELRLQTLRMQVNPHFLFNALNAIAVLVRKGDAQSAGRTITMLSRFFRRTLESSDQHWLPLEDELDMVRQYLSIAQVRFGDRLTIREWCDPAARRVAVPAMLLQPLVENAVIHGLADKVGPCELRLDCRTEGDRLRIEIADNGVGGRFFADPDFEEGVGLKNVRGRLAQFYGDAHAFELTGTPGQGTRIEIDLPLRPAAPVAA
jgi:LytS/YehU family sensor histidine kinase